MITDFVGRDEELEALEKRWASPGFEFVPVYGRRRVGKTELVLQFLNGKKAIYFQATAGTSKENLDRFRMEAGRIADLSTVREDWESTIQHLAGSTPEKFAIAIDEFPYLVDGEPALPSILQRLIDQRLKDSKLFLILTGSSIGMMLREVIDARAPLFGRRTGQILLKPLRFAQAAKMLDRPLEDCMRGFGICGGVPAYLRLFKGPVSIWKSLQENALARDGTLREEVPFLFRQELRDPKVYMTILSAIAQGRGSLGEIIDYSGLGSKTGITPYLHTLASLGYVRREVPVTESERWKKGAYSIPDKFVRFWSKFVRPQASLLEIDPDRAIDAIKAGFDEFMGPVFEDICRDIIWDLPDLPGFDRVGRWWHGGEEIDLMALGDAHRMMILGECKWGRDQDAPRMLSELRRKARLVRWNDDRREERYVLFARSFRRQVNEPGVTSVDLEVIQALVRGSRGRGGSSATIRGSSHP